MEILNLQPSQVRVMGCRWGRQGRGKEAFLAAEGSWAAAKE